MTPGQAQTLLQQAQAHQQSGRLSEALATCKTILKSRPRDFAASYFAAILQAQQGDIDAAVKFFVIAVKAKPDFIEARYNLACALGLSGRLEDAAGQYEKILNADSGNAEARLNYANTLAALGRPAEALTHYDILLRGTPSSAALLSSRASILRQLHRLDEALVDCDRAIAIDPVHAQAHFGRGVTLHELQRFDDALASYDQAIALKPRDAEFWLNRGVALYRLRRFEDAVARYDQALKIRPDYAAAWFNRGNALHELKRLDEALTCFDRVLALAPDDTSALFARGSTRLLRAEFRAGWPEYEHRPTTAPRKFKRPAWHGDSDIAGKTILIHCEQGLGDTIQFCRYIKLLEDKRADVMFAPQPAIRKLMQSLGGTQRLVDAADRSLAFDRHCSLLSLPLAFGTDHGSIPAKAAYLAAEPARAAAWAEKIGSQGFKIGVCWQGAKTIIDFGRSFALREFLPLSQVPGVRLISLQKGDGESQIAELPPSMKVETLSGFDQGPDAFLDTAAVMASLDLVITSDTAVAHLAGALGRPTWLVLQYVPDWRWLLDRDDSPWYPSMRLFRQPQPDDWQGAFSQVAAALVEQIASRQR